MVIQSLSVVVPAEKCINNCKFCVACMNDDNKLYKNQMDSNLPFYDLYHADYLKRLNFCRDNDCNTVMLTGNAEPQQNRNFLTMFGNCMHEMEKPYRWIEMQTTGALIDRDYLRFLRNHVGISTISLSVSSFNNDKNKEIISMNCGNVPFDLENLCRNIKDYDFNLRLSLNLNSEFDAYTAHDLFHVAGLLGADQITFRVLYTSGNDTPQDKWIAENNVRADMSKEIADYIAKEGVTLGKLEYGQTKYSVNGMTTVLDDDSMSQVPKSEMKYLILRPNCKLYSRWEDKASLIF